MSVSDPVVIVSSARTPLGRFQGELSSFSAHALGSHVIGAAVERAKEKLRRHGRTIEVDGVRLVVPGGWGLIRASNTQALLVLRWEAQSAEKMAELQRLIEGTVEEVRRELGA